MKEGKKRVPWSIQMYAGKRGKTNFPMVWLRRSGKSPEQAASREQPEGGCPPRGIRPTTTE